MNPVVIEVANGNAFFIGIGMTVGAFALRLWWNNRFAIILLTISWLLGISLVVLSATPISLWLYGSWFGFCIAARVAFNLRISIRTKMAVTAAFSVCSLILCAVELPYHLAKTISVSPGQTIYVVGDSISAGIDDKEKTWPSVLGDLSQIKVVNLARAGATVETAMYQTKGITASNALALVEIGGNDLLGSTDRRTFYRQLDQLLEELKGKDSRIVMFELPLLPFWNSYGSGQRMLAKKYDAVLIPKKYLVNAFAGKGNTIDGLHLSQKGHDELAKALYGLIDVRSSLVK